MTRLVSALRALVAASAISLAAAAPALAQTIDFAAFRSPVTREYQATPGGDVYQAGFGFFAAFGSGARNALATWGTDPAQEPADLYANLPSNLGGTAAALYATQFNEQINVFREDGALFSLFSIDLAHQYSSSYLLSGDLAPISITFFGFDEFGNNSSALQQTFVVTPPPILGGVRTPFLTTFRFSSAWRDLSEFAWLQGNGSGVSHQFTNVAVGVVPEPGTYALLGAGLAGVLVAARRRRVA